MEISAAVKQTNMICAEKRRRQSARHQNFHHQTYVFLHQNIFKQTGPYNFHKTGKIPSNSVIH